MRWLAKQRGKGKYEFSSLGFFVSFWAYAKKKKHHFGISQIN
jgi:hypothetical protein